MTFGYPSDGVLIECNGQERYLEMGLSNKLGDTKTRDGSGLALFY